MKKKTAKHAQQPIFPIVVESFTDLSWELGRSVLREPSCMNGSVRVEKYRITVEKVEEPIDVLRARLVELWRSTERNTHTWHPMWDAASKLLGLTQAEVRALLPLDEQGSEHKRAP